MRSNRQMRDIRLVQDKVGSKVGLCNVRIIILTGHGLDHEEDNSREERRDTVEFNNSVGGS